MRAYRHYAYLGVAVDAPQQNFAQLVSDLVGMRDQVSEDAPALSSQWGWLASQGQALAQGQSASITQDSWVAQYRSFWAALQNALPTQDVSVDQNFISNMSTDASYGLPQGIQADVDTYGAAAQSIDNSFGQYVPWIVGAVVVAIALPSIIGAFRK